mgnify:CR=1 FL=1
MGLALCMGALLVLLARQVVGLYVDQPAILLAAPALLAWVALYHLGDAVQAVSLFVLRSYRVTVAPLLIYGVLLWGLGLAGGYHGIGPWPAQQQPAAFWTASALALGLVAVLFLLLMARVTRTRPA